MYNITDWLVGWLGDWVGGWVGRWVPFVGLLVGSNLRIYSKCVNPLDLSHFFVKPLVPQKSRSDS